MKIGPVDREIICLKFYLKKNEWVGGQIIHDEPCEIELRYTIPFWNAKATNVGKWANFVNFHPKLEAVATSFDRS